MSNELDAFKSLFSHTIEIPVIWGDMDAFQHVNNTVYFRYFENVRIEYFELVGINRLMATEKDWGQFWGRLHVDINCH